MTCFKLSSSNKYRRHSFCVQGCDDIKYQRNKTDCAEFGRSVIQIANSGVLENVMFFVKWFEAGVIVCLNMNKCVETRNLRGVLCRRPVVFQLCMVRQLRSCDIDSIVNNCEKACVFFCPIVLFLFLIHFSHGYYMSITNSGNRKRVASTSRQCHILFVEA